MVRKIGGMNMIKIFEKFNIPKFENNLLTMYKEHHDIIGFARMLNVLSQLNGNLQLKKEDKIILHGKLSFDISYSVCAGKYLKTSNHRSCDELIVSNGKKNITLDFPELFGGYKGNLHDYTISNEDFVEKSSEMDPFGEEDWDD